MSSNIKRIVKSEKRLRQPNAPVTEQDDAERYAELLFDNLLHHEGIGLSAPQIGINKQICVVNVTEPLVLVNPEIINREGDVEYVESCLSFPDSIVKTKRNIRVTVRADNFEGDLTFGPESNNPHRDNEELLESVAVQHEIDHLHGKLMFDHEIKRQPIEVQHKFGRNDRVKIQDIVSGDIKTLKYKHTEKYLEDGWKVIGKM